MGRAIRWLKGMFGIKNSNPDRSSDDPKRRSIEKLHPSLSDVAEATWRKPYYHSEKEKEQQRKHTMAVAAATSAAADAALAAARAAVAVVRLTGHGSSTALHGRNRYENAAAVMIQTVFRGYLVCAICFKSSSSP